ncbi:MAG TPA: NUDIX hydrolase [Candidatus Saccharimonadales bacterium]
MNEDTINLRKIQRDIVGAFIFSSDDKLLLGKSIKGGVYPDCWIVPGGGVEPNETLLEALKRETLEETGIDITDALIEQIEGELSGQSEKTLRDTSEKVLVEMTFYNFKVTLPEPADSVKLIHEDDFVEAEWFNSDELSGIKLSQPTITTLQRMGLL